VVRYQVSTGVVNYSGRVLRLDLNI